MECSSLIKYEFELQYFPAHNSSIEKQCVQAVFVVIMIRPSQKMSGLLKVRVI